MTTSHLDYQTLWKLYERKLPYRVEKRALDHLASCTDCRQRLEQLSSGHGVAETSPSTAEGPSFQGTSEELSDPVASRIPLPAYGPVLDRAMKSLIGENARLDVERSQVGGLLRDLDGLSSSQQRLLIQNSPRHQTWALVEGLLDACRTGWSEDPERSERLAERALDVANCLTVSGFRRQLLNDLKADGWGYIANCRRIRSDFFAAERAFHSAWACLADGSGDLGARAGILDLEASLQLSKRNLPAAERLLSEAIDCYRALGDHHREGRALLNVATCRWMRGELTQALTAMEGGSRLFDAQQEPALEFIFKKNMMLLLVDLGRLDEARGLLPEVRELGRKHASRLERLRLRWSEAILLIRVGQPEMAEEILWQVREGFIAAEIGYDVALVSLDLAGIALEQGRRAEVRQLAQETYPLFASRGVSREALAAWNLFRNAASRDAVTVALVEDIAGRIRQTRSGRSPVKPGSH